LPSSQSSSASTWPSGQVAGSVVLVSVSPVDDPPEVVGLLELVGSRAVVVDVYEVVEVVEVVDVLVSAAAGGSASGVQPTAAA